MKLHKTIAVAGILAGAILSASAQDNTSIVTNIVTMTVTNVVTVTNIITQIPVPVPAIPALAPDAVIKYPWVSSVTAGLTLTRGNSDSLLASIKLVTDRKTPVNEYIGDADGAYGSASGVENTAQIHGFAQWNHLFSEKWYGYLRGEGLHDGIAEVKYRFTFTLGVGYYIIKQANTTLAAEVGPGVVAERVGDINNTYATLRLAERGEHKFKFGGARIWETVEILPQVNKLSYYLVNAEVGVSSALSKSLSLSVCLDDNFNSDPAPGLQKNDVKLVSGVTYNF